MTDPRHAQAQLALTLSRNMQQMIERQSQRVARVGSQLVRHGQATGFVDISGAGESLAQIDFPIVFVEKPVFTFGFELGASSWLTQGSFPLGTATVAKWKTQDMNGTPTWVGAQVAIVLTGISGAAVLDYMFVGNSLATPTGAS